MWGWFAPRCPLGAWEKTWTETRMCWLTERFGIDRLLRTEVVLPTEQYFPDHYPPGGSGRGAQRFLERLCKYMKIDHRTIELEVCPDEELGEAAGDWRQDSDRNRSLIRLAESNLPNPQSVLATLAHELAHELLHGRGLLDDSVTDHEWITDLLPVYLGVGVFAANSTLHEAYHTDGNLSWWLIGKQGYLPSRIFGYAMALFAFMREELDPAWASHLRLDASSPLRKGLSFLHKTDDSLFHPDSIRAGRTPLTPGEAVIRLHAKSASVRLSTLWEIQKSGLSDPACLEAVVKCLEDRDPEIPGDAARTLAGFGPAAAVAVPALLRALRFGNDRTRAGAAEALGELGQQREIVVPELCALLGEGDQALMLTTATALGRFERPVDPRSVRRLVGCLEAAMVNCDGGLEETLVDTLLIVAPDPEAAVGEYFMGRDEELLHRALGLLAEQRK